MSTKLVFSGVLILYAALMFVGWFIRASASATGAPPFPKWDVTIPLGVGIATLILATSGV